MYVHTYMYVSVCISLSLSLSLYIYIYRERENTITVTHWEDGYSVKRILLLSLAVLSYFRFFISGACMVAIFYPFSLVEIDVSLV